MATLMLSCMFIGLLIIHTIHCYNFGFNNRYTCHCINNERCDTVTGGCNNGCLRGWGGPSCQQENIALDSNSVSQSGTYDDDEDLYGPQLVVDGYNDTDRDINYCSETETDNSPWQWWAINLQQSYTIGYLKIFHQYGRLHLFKGFSVHIDNELCFKHTGTSNPPAVYPIECNRTITGRNVNISRFSNTHNYIALCEVEIYVCSQGTYRLDCNNFCHCSNNDKCDVITGQCSNGCQIGWHGNSCNKKCSTINKYGVGCEKRCDDRQCSGNSSCDHVTGECSNGCTPGYQGIDCSQECPSGTYGESCNKQCNIQCKGSQECHHITGKCNDGCKPGYTKDDCSLKCDEGFYGYKCASYCSARFCLSEDDLCNNIDGACDDCIEGFIGNDCTIVKKANTDTEYDGKDITIIILAVVVCILAVISITFGIYIFTIKYRKIQDKKHADNTDYAVPTTEHVYEDLDSRNNPENTRRHSPPVYFNITDGVSIAETS